MKTAGQSSASLAEMVDFYPTLAELCGLSSPSKLSGVSLAGVLDDASASPRTSAFTQHAKGYTLRTDRYRYTEWGTDGVDGKELYDHQSDPAEMVNLAKRPESAPNIAELSKSLRERVAKARQVPDGLVQTPPADGERTGRRSRAAAGGQK
jgi:arylsulfatase A-like enzyme